MEAAELLKQAFFKFWQSCIWREVSELREREKKAQQTIRAKTKSNHKRMVLQRDLGSIYTHFSKDVLNPEALLPFIKDKLTKIIDRISQDYGPLILTVLGTEKYSQWIDVTEKQMSEDPDSKDNVKFFLLSNGMNSNHEHLDITRHNVYVSK